MTSANQIARVARMVGEPARAAMLMTLMDGRAFTAAELARTAGITPQTASSHLAGLREAGLITVLRQGRHRYHRLSGPRVAQWLEDLMAMAPASVGAGGPVMTGPREPGMRTARTCYDHFAGRLGVAIAQSLTGAGAVEIHDEAALITDAGMELLGRHGMRIGPGASARPLCRPCLDWSERRFHIGGRLGAEICRHFFARGWSRRVRDSRAVQITAGGRRALLDIFGIRSL